MFNCGAEYWETLLNKTQTSKQKNVTHHAIPIDDKEPPKQSLQSNPFYKPQSKPLNKTSNHAR